MGFLFGLPKIEGDKRRQCLAYLEEQWKINSFQKKESDLYDNSVMELSNSSVTERHTIEEMRRAANRLAQSIRESLRRLREISSAPDAVSTVWHAWELRYSDYLAWATAQASIADALLYNRTSAEAQLQHLHKLTLKRDKSLHKAIDETTRLMRHLKLSDDEHARLLQAAEDAQNDDWQPKLEGGTATRGKPNKSLGGEL